MEEPQDRNSRAAPPAPWLRLLTLVGGLVIVGSVVFIGLRVGQAFLGQGPIESLRGELHEVQTTSATYVGRIIDVSAGYVLLAEPAVLTAQATPDGEATEFLVEALTADPYGIHGAIAIREEQIIHAGSVAPGSGLAGAYQAATTGQSEQDTDP